MDMMDILSNVNSVILIGFATAFLLTIMLLKQRGVSKQRVPPGPGGIPILGHFHLFAMNKVESPHKIFASLAAKYGPIMHLKLGNRRVLVVTSSDLAKECFTTNDLCFASRPLLASAQHMGYNFASFILSPYGPYWRIARKVSTLKLLSAKRIQQFAATRAREINKAVNSFFQQSLLKKNINVRHVLSEMTLKILLEMIMRDRCFGEDLGMSPAEATHLLEESFKVAGAINVGDYIPWLKWFDLQGYERTMKKLHVKLDAFMQKVVEKHRANPVEDEEEMDFVDMLIAEAEENKQSIPDRDSFIKATAHLMLSAGSDTASVTLEWALSLLLCQPQLIKKAQEEIDTKVGRNRPVEESDIPELRYLQAIVKETMRLHPPAPLLLPHESMETCTVGGFHIPPETTLIVNVWAIHRDPKIWNKPLEFVPERFTEGNVEVDLQMKGNNFEMIPFGAGRRSCPGSSLAICIIQIALARLLQSFEWFVPDGQVVDMTEGSGVTTPRAVPLEVVLKPRLPHHLY